jgi:hypothetical protein
MWLSICREAPRGARTGFPGATLFLTVLFLPQLTEDLQYQRVVKDQAAPNEEEAALNHISSASVSLLFIPSIKNMMLRVTKVTPKGIRAQDI